VPPHARTELGILALTHSIALDMSEQRGRDRHPGDRPPGGGDSTPSDRSGEALPRYWVAARKGLDRGESLDLSQPDPALMIGASVAGARRWTTPRPSRTPPESAADVCAYHTLL